MSIYISGDPTPHGGGRGREGGGSNHSTRTPKLNKSGGVNVRDIGDRKDGLRGRYGTVEYIRTFYCSRHLSGMIYRH